MSDAKKKEDKAPEEEPHVSQGEGDVQVLGFVQEPDGHGFSDEFLAEREAALQREQAHAVSQGVIDAPEEKPEEKPKAKPVAMDTGVKASS